MVIKQKIERSGKKTAPEVIVKSRKLRAQLAIQMLKTLGWREEL